MNLCLIAVVMVMAPPREQSGALTVGRFVMVNAYMIQIMMPLNFLGNMYREIRQALVDMDEMFNLLEQPAEVVDRPDAKPLVVTGGEITFDRVEFGYDPERPILKGLSFRVPPGERVAVVGSTGAGKSTIGRLLFRFYDVTGGAIRIDGQDLREVTQASLHAAIGVVPQDTVLFNDTIGYNIAYGRDGRHAGADRGRRPRRPHPRLHRAPAPGLRHPGGRARPQALGRREAARGHRPHAPQEPAHPDPRRGDLRPRHRDRGRHPVRAQRDGARAAASSSSPTAFAPWPTPTASSCSRTAAWSRRAPRPLLAKGGRYAELWSMQTREEELQAAE
jgi:hypothetical protein